MKKAFASLFVICLLTQGLLAQNKGVVRPSAIGVSFILNDFTTAQRIRTGSLGTVISNKKWAKFSEMAPGLALTYFKGLTKNLDFAGTLGASFANYPFQNRPAFASDGLLTEGDLSINLKLLSESYWVTPYLSAGIGASQYKAYWGAIMPVGAGLKLNLFDEASLFVQSQYRIAVTPENASYHFMYSIGVSGIIGKQRRL